jgi:hypothetical protein
VCKVGAKKQGKIDEPRKVIQDERNEKKKESSPQKFQVVLKRGT